MALEPSRRSLLEWIDAWRASPEPFAPGAFDPSVFEAHALQRFGDHYAQIDVYRAYCDAVGRRPEDVGSWRQIPLLPSSAFKRSAAQVEAAVVNPKFVFETSGTTDGAPGSVRLTCTEVYDAASLATFRHLVPTAKRVRCLSLVPGSDIRPKSSLGHMVDHLSGALSDRKTDALIVADPSGSNRQDHVDSARLLEILRLAGRQSCGHETVPLVIFGTTIALDVALRSWPAEVEIALPVGSIVMDTGGPKGRDRHIDRAEQHARMASAWGVSASHIVGELGMTELSSQRYETTLRAELCGDITSTRAYVGPPWLRSVVLDPDTMQPVPLGTMGLVGHIDLANIESCAFVLTGDLGVLVEVDPGVEGLRLHGRAPGTVLRGCGLLIDEATG